MAKKFMGLLAFGAFFGACLYAFHYAEGHPSTEYKQTIKKLEAKVEKLSEQVTSSLNFEDALDGLKRYVDIEVARDGIRAAGGEPPGGEAFPELSKKDILDHISIAVTNVLGEEASTEEEG